MSGRKPYSRPADSHRDFRGSKDSEYEGGVGPLRGINFFKLYFETL